MDPLVFFGGLALFGVVGVVGGIALCALAEYLFQRKMRNLCNGGKPWPSRPQR